MKNYEPIEGFKHRVLIHRPTQEELDEESRKCKFHTNPRPCLICGASFDYGTVRRVTCGLCDVICYCENCGKEIHLKQVDDEPHFCGKMCNFSMPGECRVCHQIVATRDCTGAGKECGCSKRWYTEHNAQLTADNTKAGECVKCHRWVESRSGAGLCGNCVGKVVERQWQDDGIRSSRVARMIERGKEYSTPGECAVCHEIVQKRSIMKMCDKCMSEACGRPWKRIEFRERMSVVLHDIATKRSRENTEPDTCVVCNQWKGKRNGFGMCTDCLAIVLEKRWADEDWAAWMTKLLQEAKKEAWQRDGYLESIRQNLHDAAVKRTEKATGPGECSRCHRMVQRRNAFHVCIDCLLGFIVHPVFDYQAALERLHGDLESVESLDSILGHSKTLINMENLESYDGVPGVWALYGQLKDYNVEDGDQDQLVQKDGLTCLTLGETVNMKKEIEWTVRVLANNDLQSAEEESPGITGRWAEIQRKYHNFVWLEVVKNEHDPKDRQSVEMLHAVKHMAKYWLPNIVQAYLMKGGSCLEETFGNHAVQDSRRPA